MYVIAEGKTKERAIFVLLTLFFFVCVVCSFLLSLVFFSSVCCVCTLALFLFGVLVYVCVCLV